MATERLNIKKYSDAAYVEGMYRRDPFVEQALYNHCKQYFDENYRGIFFIGNEHKDEIFQETFIKMWENIEHRKIYVEDGILLGKGGEPLSCNLTTYLMGIARLKYLEWVREHRTLLNRNEKDRIWQSIDIESYKELLYDEGDDTMLTIIADCISHMSERCNQILTMFYYEEKTLDDIMLELPAFESKNALKTRKYKCMEELRRSARTIYRRYLNA